MELSIIVPVYNTEPFLRECIDSILGQSYTDFELLLIDDGSPDSSGSICDEFAWKDHRIKVFHKQNGGVSSARNYGLDKACGQWVTFIDSDDIISPTFIEGLYQPIANDEILDFVHGGCTNWKEGMPAGINQIYDYYVGTEPEIVFREIRGLTFSKLFRLENIKTWSNGLGLRFDENMKIAEDMAFTLDYLQTVKRYAFVPEVGYYYRIDNMNSATKSHKIIPYEEKFRSFAHIDRSCESYMKMANLYESQSVKRLSQIAEIQFDTIISIYRNDKTKKERLSILRKDWSGDNVYYMKYLRSGRVKSILAKIIVNKKLALFDFIISLVMKIKLLISSV